MNLSSASRPGIDGPAFRHRIGVEMTVEDQAFAAAGALEDADGIGPACRRRDAPRHRGQSPSSPRPCGEREWSRLRFRNRSMEHLPEDDGRVSIAHGDFLLGWHSAADGRRHSRHPRRADSRSIRRTKQGIAKSGLARCGSMSLESHLRALAGSSRMAAPAIWASRPS